MAKAGAKGTQGKRTGGSVRSAIRAAERSGMTQGQIARIARRSPSTINSIKTGEIKNPPEGLAERINRAVARRKK